LKTFDDILNHLEADILCFQGALLSSFKELPNNTGVLSEMKCSRQGLPKQVALPPSFDSFFSFPIRKSGYSGIAIYTRKSAVVPLKAEEGLTGLIQPKPSLKPSEQISQLGTYPPDIVDPTIPEDEDEIDYKDLDSEGRAIVVDLGLFVLISVYCPNHGTGTEERSKFKMDYHRLLEARVDGLIKAGREVMVVGDLNACAAVQDHCEGQLMVERGLAEGLQGEEGFWGLDYRRWIRDWLIRDDGHRGGSMVDIVRKFWPDRKGMYTCAPTSLSSSIFRTDNFPDVGWNTKISARESNYGTRIDFILVTPGLVPWVKAADIQPQIKGSDHCPVYVDLWDEITQPDGTVLKLSSVIGAQADDGDPVEPPRLAAKFWEEYKQKLLSTFFGKGEKSAAPPCDDEKATTTMTHSTQPLTMSQSSDNLPSTPILTDTDSPSIDINAFPSQSSTPPPFESSLPPSGSSSSNTILETKVTKRKLAPENPKASSIKKTQLSQPRKETQKRKAGQSTIASFFQPSNLANAKHATATLKSKTSKSIPFDRTPPSASGNSSANEPESELMELGEDADYRLALFLSQTEGDAPIPSSSQGSFGATSGGGNSQPGPHRESRQAQWNTLLAPTPVPKCNVHQEPAKELTVNKPGQNKGKKFFICSRSAHLSCFLSRRRLNDLHYEVLLVLDTTRAARSVYGNRWIRSGNVTFSSGPAMCERR